MKTILNAGSVKCWFNDMIELTAALRNLSCEEMALKGFVFFAGGCATFVKAFNQAVAIGHACPNVPRTSSDRCNIFSASGLNAGHTMMSASECGSKTKLHV